MEAVREIESEGSDDHYQENDELCGHNRIVRIESAKVQRATGEQTVRITTFCYHLARRSRDCGDTHVDMSVCRASLIGLTHWDRVQGGGVTLVTVLATGSSSSR
ncbi:hypothetical protein RE943_37100 [Prescottella equi]|nr:hypothetical protein RE943_37100 [Prescottella equi]